MYLNTTSSSTYINTCNHRPSTNSSPLEQDFNSNTIGAYHSTEASSQLSSDRSSPTMDNSQAVVPTNSINTNHSDLERYGFFGALPNEILDDIFDYTSIDYNHARYTFGVDSMGTQVAILDADCIVPALVVALRSQPRAHRVAIKWYSEFWERVMIEDSSTFQVLLSFSKSERACIRCLDLTIEYVFFQCLSHDHELNNLLAKNFMTQ